MEHVLIGRSGDDTPLGDIGDDILRGGAGQDILQISKGINGTDIESADDLAARVQQVGTDAAIDLGNGDSITLRGVDADDVNTNPTDYFSVQ